MLATLKYIYIKLYTSLNIVYIFRIYYSILLEVILILSLLSKALGSKTILYLFYLNFYFIILKILYSFDNNYQFFYFLKK